MTYSSRWLSLGISALALAWPGAAAGARAVSTSLVDYVKSVKSLLPTEGSRKYVVPTLEDRQVFHAVAAALARGDASAGERLLTNYRGFEILDFEDQGGSGRYLALVEKPPVDRGWGFYFFAHAPSRPQLVLEAPHPIADRDSEVAAAVAATSLRPAAVLFAGAHRFADPARLSDVAHVSDSIFESVHEVAMVEGRFVVQVHGFSSASHIGYPELLLSSGTSEPGPAATTLCSAMVLGGLGCKLFDGSAFVDLGAQTNVQGAAVRRGQGAGHFFHMETADDVRDDPGRLSVVVDAIAAQWPATAPASGGCSLAPHAPAATAVTVALAAFPWWVVRRRSGPALARSCEPSPSTRYARRPPC